MSSTATVLNSAGVSFSVSNSVLNSAGVAFEVGNDALNSAGSAFTIFTEFVTTTPGNRTFIATDSRSFTAAEQIRIFTASDDRTFDA